jgi:ribosomal protein S18 acetylase RimI-like enzyme
LSGHLRPAIADLERATAEHWQAADQGELGEWQLRAAGGFTGRANSALPLGDPGMPLAAAVDATAAWYRSRDLPAMIVVPRPLGPVGPSAGGPSAADAPCASLDRLLAARGWTIRSGPAIVMTAAIAGLPRHDAGMTQRPKSASGATPTTPEALFGRCWNRSRGQRETSAREAGVREAGVTVSLASEPSPDWLSIYRYRGQPLPGNALNLLLSAPWQAFATAVRDGRSAAVGRVSVAAGWAGIAAVEVAAEHRRGGLGTAVTLALAQAAAERGVDRVFLQVEEGNSAARALYARCGFRDAHAYHYRVAPAAPR